MTPSEPPARACVLLARLPGPPADSGRCEIPLVGGPTSGRRTGRLVGRW